jgi:putative ABC transport system ATP-binding protein
LARALLRRPRVLLADEPTAHLDDDSAAAVLGLLAELAQEEAAMLVVATHDARVAEVLKAAATWRLLAPEPMQGRERQQTPASAVTAAFQP